MTEFILDKRLLNDCHLITEDDNISYLLHRNAEVVWFILVPHTLQVEFYQLDKQSRERLYEEINQLSEFISSNFDIHKINIATIGNVVSQMHIHVIGRRTDDLYWPDVVWGKGFNKTYDQDQVSLISDLLVARLKNE